MRASRVLYDLPTHVTLGAKAAAGRAAGRRRPFSATVDFRSVAARAIPPVVPEGRRRGGDRNSHRRKSISVLSHPAAAGIIE